MRNLIVLALVFLCCDFVQIQAHDKPQVKAPAATNDSKKKELDLAPIKKDTHEVHLANPGSITPGLGARIDGSGVVTFTAGRTIDVDPDKDIKKSDIRGTIKYGYFESQEANVEFSKMSIGTNVSLDFLVFGAGLNFRYDEKSLKSAAKTSIYVIRTTTAKSESVVVRPKVVAELLNAKPAGNGKEQGSEYLARVIDRFGSHYVKDVHYGHAIVLKIDIEAKSEVELEQVRLAIRGSYLAVFKGDGKFDLDKVATSRGVKVAASALIFGGKIEPEANSATYITSLDDFYGLMVKLKKGEIKINDGPYAATIATLREALPFEHPVDALLRGEVNIIDSTEIVSARNKILNELKKTVSYFGEEPVQIPADNDATVLNGKTGLRSGVAKSDGILFLTLGHDKLKLAPPGSPSCEVKVNGKSVSYSNINWAALTVPVRKGDKWEVKAYVTGGGAEQARLGARATGVPVGALTVRWLPLGPSLLYKEGK